MMTILCVKAMEVQIGDELPTGERAPFDFTRVKSVDSVAGHTVIRTVSWDTWKHPLEAVGVRRGSP